jgi:asparagine N-glycosylation enzyme membrane subunit Stt3
MALSEILENAIRFIQLIFVPFFGLMFLVALFFLLFAFKNPHKKRKAYLFSIGGFVGMMLALYLPLIIAYFKLVNQPASATGDETLRNVVDITQPWGTKAYNVFYVIFEPLIYFGFVYGIAVWLLSAKNPARKRIGMGMVFGAPIFLIILQYSPEIYHFFVPGLQLGV